MGVIEKLIGWSQRPTKSGISPPGWCSATNRKKRNNKGRKEFPRPAGVLPPTEKRGIYNLISIITKQIKPTPARVVFCHQPKKENYYRKQITFVNPIQD
jgi:hypothetical protein